MNGYTGIWAATVAAASGAGAVFGQTDVFSGSGGWAGAGLLGLVLGWLLLKHLPDKDKQIIDLVTAKDTAVTELTAAYKEDLKEERSTFLAALRKWEEHSGGA